jgi:Flp pilus assembly protein TadD
VRIAPADAGFHYNVAMMFSRKGQMTEAVHHYSEGLRLKPTDSEAHYRLGVIFADQGRIGEAAGHFQAAVRLDPHFQKARRALDDLTGRPRLDTR